MRNQGSAEPQFAVLNFGIPSRLPYRGKERWGRCQQLVLTNRAGT